MNEPNFPLGTIVAFALNTNNIPDRWLLCDGSAIPATGYQELITALGQPNTPNLAGRTLIGTGVPSMGPQSDGTTPNFDPSNNWPLNYTGGEFAHELAMDEMPSHQHSLEYQFDLASDCHSGSGSTPCLSGSTRWTNVTGGDSNNNTVFHNTMQPYFAVNYIIYGGSS